MPAPGARGPRVTLPDGRLRHTYVQIGANEMFEGVPVVFVDWTCWQCGERVQGYENGYTCRACFCEEHKLPGYRPSRPPGYDPEFAARASSPA